GRPVDEATRLLEDAGFIVSVFEEFSDDVASGRVISQDPEARTDLQPGEGVTIMVSLGPPEFPMPNVVGMRRDAAVARLRDLGLVVSVAIVPGQDGTTVVYQEPAAGTTVHAGDTVDIFVA
ncbi:MAG: PASTA domain-containing protein, partial [Actinomycetota bacterium]